MTSNFFDSQMFCQSEQIILVFLGVGVIFEGHLYPGHTYRQQFSFLGLNLAKCQFISPSLYLPSL